MRNVISIMYLKLSSRVKKRVLYKKLRSETIMLFLLIINWTIKQFHG